MTPELDRDQAQRYLEALDPEGMFAFQTFDDDKERRGRIVKERGHDPLACVLTGTLDEHYGTLADLNGQGAGVYVTVNQTDGNGRLTENITMARAVFVDFDNVVPSPSLIKLEPNIIVQSRAGQHMYWLLEPSLYGAVEWQRWRWIQREMARKLGGDPQIHDPPRVMRVPGFWHCKRHPWWTVQTVSYKPELPHYIESMIMDAWGIGVEPTRDRTPPTSNVLDLNQLDRRQLRCRAYLDKVEPAVDGAGGYNHTKYVCGIGGDFGLEPDEYWPLLAEWNTRCVPPWDERELRQKLERVHQARRDPMGKKLDEREDPDPDVMRLPRRQRVHVTHREGPKPPGDVPLPDVDVAVVTSDETRDPIALRGLPEPEPEDPRPDAPPHEDDDSTGEPAPEPPDDVPPDDVQEEHDALHNPGEPPGDIKDEPILQVVGRLVHYQSSPRSGQHSAEYKLPVQGVNIQFKKPPEMRKLEKFCDTCWAQGVCVELIVPQGRHATVQWKRIITWLYANRLVIEQEDDASEEGALIERLEQLLIGTKLVETPRELKDGIMLDEDGSRIVSISMLYGALDDMKPRPTRQTIARVLEDAFDAVEARVGGKRVRRVPGRALVHVVEDDEEAEDATT